jgi:hypothetical protein
VPRQEPLPPVLAVILVDQRLVVVAAAIVGKLVEVINPAKRVAQRVEFGLAQAIEVGTLARLAVAVGVTSQARLRDVKLQVDDLGPRHLAGRDGERRGTLVVGRTAVVDPLGDEIDIRGGDVTTAPHESGKPAAAKRRYAAQPTNKTGRETAVALTGAARCLDRRCRRDQVDPEDSGVQELIERQLPETAEPAVIGGLAPAAAASMALTRAYRLSGSSASDAFAAMITTSTPISRYGKVNRRFALAWARESRFRLALRSVHGSDCQAPAH